MPARIISGTDDCGNGRPAEDGEGIQAMLLGDRSPDRGAEQVGIEEVADVVGAEDIVAQRPVLLHRQTQPAEAGLRPVERHQNVVEAEEHRDLREHRQAAEDRVEAVLALKLLHLQRHPLAVFAVLLLQRFDLGCSSCIWRVVRICRTNGLYSNARRVNTRNITDSAQAKKLLGPRRAANSLYHSHMIPDTG